MSEHNAVAVVYNPHTEAEAAVKELQKSEFDMPTVSLVGKDSHTAEHVIGPSYNVGARMQFWGTRGALWGGVVGPAVRLGLLLERRGHGGNGAHWGVSAHCHT